MTTTLTKRQLGRRLRVAPATIARWLDDGRPAKVPGRPGVPTRFDLGAVIAWKRERDTAAQASGGSLAQARAKREEVAARLMEQTIASRSGCLVDASAVERVWSQNIAAVRTRLMAWSVTLADRVTRAATTGGLGVVEATIHLEVRQVLRELSEEPLTGGGDDAAERVRASEREVQRYADHLAALRRPQRRRTHWQAAAERGGAASARSRRPLTGSPVEAPRETLAITRRAGGFRSATSCTCWAS
jgi:hypothetical protein